MQPALGRERRSRRHRAAQPLQAGEQRRLLADDVGARALDDRHVEGEVRAEHRAPEQARPPRHGGRELERGLRARVLRAREDEAVVGADGVARERHALQQQLGVLLHEELVDVGAGVALVAVGDDELALARGRAGELPLRAGGEAGAAAPAHVRGLDDIEQVLGRHRRDRARQAVPRVPGGEQHGLVERAARWRLAGVARRAGDDPLDDARPGVDEVAVADGRRGVAEAEADRLGERDGAVGGALAELAAQRRAELVDVGVGGRGEARGAGADAHVAHAAGLQEVVVEGRHAVDGGLRQPRALGGEAAIVVGDLAVVGERGLEHLERRRRAELVMPADDLDEVARHGSSLRNRWSRADDMRLVRQVRPGFTGGRGWLGVGSRRSGS